MRRPRIMLVPLAAAGLVVLGILLGTGRSASARPRLAEVAPLPAAALARLKAESRPAGRGPRFQVPVHGSVVGACRRGLRARYGAHVEFFADDLVVPVPRGVGVRGTESLASGRIVGAGCFGTLVTIDPTGLVLIRPGETPTLGQLFREWGEPLSRTRMAAFIGRVRVFIDGRRYRGDPSAIRLARHLEVALEVGAYIPPHASYDFPPGT